MMIKIRKISLFLFLTCTFWFSVLSYPLPAQALTDTYPSFYQIGEDTVYYDVDGMDNAGYQKVRYIEYTPNEAISPIVEYGSKLYGKSTISALTNYVQEQERNVIAAINGDFFDTTNGVPVSMVIKDGVLISSNLGYYAAGFKSDGSVIIGKPSVNMVLVGASGSVTVTSFNKMRSNSSVCLLDTNFSRETRISSSGVNVVLERLDDKPVTVNSSLSLKVVSVGKQSVSTPIAENQMVLTVSDKGPVSSLPDFKVGEPVTFYLSSDGSAWKDVIYAVGGKLLVQNGQFDLNSNPAGTRARSALGVKKDGTVVLFTVDQGDASYSNGMSPQTLASEMQALGCTDVLNLDGGGSTAMSVLLPGDDAVKLVNQPSDGVERQCANYIFLVNNEKASGQAAHLHIYPDCKYILPGATMNLSIKATDKNYYAVAAPSDIIYDVKGDNGKMDGSAFTAGESVGAATVTAEADGISAEEAVYIINSLDNIKVTASNASTALSTLNLIAGQTIDLNAAGIYRSHAVAANDALFTWKVGGGIGSVNSQGLLTASTTFGSGTLTVSYGNCEKTIAVKVSPDYSNDYLHLDTFEALGTFKAADGLSISLTKDPDYVYSGYGALKLAYDFTANTASILSCSALPVDGDNWYLGLWVLDPNNSGSTITARFLNSAGQTVEVPLAVYGNKLPSGYKLWRGAIPADAVSLTGLKVTKGTLAKGALYIDQLMAASADKLSAAAPVIAIASIPSEFTASADSYVVFKISSNCSYLLSSENTHVTLDGEDLIFSIDSEKNLIGMHVTGLSPGLHRLTVTAAAPNGQLARKSVNFTVAGTAGDAVSFADISSGHWAIDYVKFMNGKGIFVGETGKDGLNYFYPSRNLTRMEFAVLMTRYLNLSVPENMELSFVDNEDIPAWAVDAVKSVYHAGLMSGTPVNSGLKFNPRANISRAEVMTVIGRSLSRGYGLQETAFSDASAIPSWALSHINYLTALGIVDGYADGSIAPTKSITRAESAKLLFGLY